MPEYLIPIQDASFHSVTSVLDIQSDISSSMGLALKTVLLINSQDL